MTSKSAFLTSELLVFHPADRTLCRHATDTVSTSSPDYTQRLVSIAQISTVQTFWQVYNNYPAQKLAFKDSLHLFKRTVKPVWEDPRNARGGCWTFRVPKAQSMQFWTEISLMAIGEILDVTEPGDDICGISISNRFKSDLITVWNRDGSNEKSIEKIKNLIIEKLSEDLRPQKDNPKDPYYKKHSDHEGFKVPEKGLAVTTMASSDSTVDEIDMVTKLVVEHKPDKWDILAKKGSSDGDVVNGEKTIS
jgi:Eukaryotic initiation factor 4E